MFVNIKNPVSKQLLFTSPNIHHLWQHNGKMYKQSFTLVDENTIYRRTREMACSCSQVKQVLCTSYEITKGLPWMVPYHACFTDQSPHLNVSINFCSPATHTIKPFEPIKQIWSSLASSPSTSTFSPNGPTLCTQQ